MKRKICVVTGTRAEYGLLYWLTKGIEKEPKLELQFIATGMHCSPEFGNTYLDIEKDGFSIDKKIEMIISSDTPQSISKSTGLGLISFADAFFDLKPDIIVVLGDRYELLSATIAGLFARIPVAHIHGGETTEGAFDEAIRHSISKMSWWHFVANKEYENRVIQLGEDPSRVFMVGGMGVDAINKTKLLNKNKLETALNFKLNKRNLLVTFHPVTFENNTTKKQFRIILDCLNELENTNIIFTYTNSDTNGRVINTMINDFIINNPSSSIAFTSMGRVKYLSTLQFVDAVLGNSSSGLLEAPSFKIGTINIGDRQKGRLRASSVIDCSPNFNSIKNAIEKIYSKNFKQKLKSVINPYGKGSSSDKIIDVLVNTSMPRELKKKFYNLG